MTANVITDEEIRMGSQKLCLTFSKLLVLKDIFYNMLSQQKNLHSVTCILFLTSGFYLQHPHPSEGLMKCLWVMSEDCRIK